MSAPIVLALRIGMTLSLYAFLGWAFLLLWREFRTQSELLTKKKISPLSLLFESNEGEKQARHFRQPEITLGRDPHCEIYLENETVSAHHARLSYHHGQWWLEDLQSTNGTTLNGEKVDTATIVIGNDKIRCGEVALTIRFAVDDLSPNTRKF